MADVLRNQLPKGKAVNNKASTEDAQLDKEKDQELVAAASRALASRLLQYFMESLLKTKSSFGLHFNF